jgi:hypothetical protein
MDRTGTLAALNGRILRTYSARTVAALRGALPFRIVLPHLEPVLALNVQKEIRKDALVIEQTGRAWAAGARIGREDAQRLFAASQAIDREFVAKTESFPVRVVVPYVEIEPLRIRRIQYVAGAVHRILSAWQAETRLRAALHSAFVSEDFELLLATILDLYARETRALSRAVQLPQALAPLQERLARHVGTVMSETAMRLAQELALRLYTS